MLHQRVMGYSFRNENKKQIDSECNSKILGFVVKVNLNF